MLNMCEMIQPAVIMMLSTCFKTWNVNSIGVSGIPGAEKPERSMGDVNDFSRTRRVSHLSLLAFGPHAHGHVYVRSLLPLLLRHIYLSCKMETCMVSESGSYELDQQRGIFRRKQ